MPTINNETVIGSGYATYRNARPQLLDNGWIVVALYNGSAGRLQFRVKKTSTSAWEDLAFLTTSGVLSWTLAVKGNRVLANLHTSSANATYHLNFDATTVSGTVSLSAASIDNTSLTGAFNGEDMIINDAGTELHYVFSAKTSTYASSFNARYMKGTIATDGSVTWSSVEQVTLVNSDYDIGGQNPVIVLMNGIPTLFVESSVNLYAGSQGWYPSTGIIMLKRDNSLIHKPGSGRVNTGWTGATVYFNTGSSNYPAISPTAKVMPKAISGLATDRIWLAFALKNSSYFNIYTGYSDDGINFSFNPAQTTGNLYNQTNPSLTIEKNGKVLLYWESDQSGLTYEKIYSAGVWGNTNSLSGSNNSMMTALFDGKFRLHMTRAPIIRRNSTTGVDFNGNYYFGALTLPDSGSIGDKAAANNILAYTVTPESGTTVTSIVEKLNGTTLNTYANPASLSRTINVPLANWDSAKYYDNHVLQVVITDSNGNVNTYSYTFRKTLDSNASLLEGAKAAKDGKDRISTKRDALAAQAGIAAGSSFDAILAALLTNTMKVAIGTVTSSGTSPFIISASGLGFQPKIVVWFTASGARVGTWIDPSFTGASDKKYVANASISADNTSAYGPDSRAIITSSSFSFATYNGASVVYTYIALG